LCVKNLLQMGVLKDAVHLTVLQHLRTQRNFQTLILSLNAPNGVGPTTIREAWSRLKDGGKDEGMKKATGLQAVLKERLDLFHFHTNERGHNLITLAPDLVDLPADSPLPARGPAYNPPLQPSAATTADPAMLSEALVAGELLQSMEALNPGAITSITSLEPKKKKTKTSSTYNGGGSMKGTSKGKFGQYQDIVWTPQIAAQNALLQQKDAAMARALFNACEVHGSKRVTLSQLGSDFNVSVLKKDSQFSNHKLIDILRFHENVFELVPDSGIGGFLVNLQPGAGAGLPDAETFFEEMTESTLLLPERIDEPRSQSQRMQGLRIELVHVVHKRGGKAALNELGQDQRVQKVKTGLPKTLKLIEFIRMFPANFTITTNPTGLMDITLDSPDCYDQSMIERNILRAQQMTQQFRDKGKGKGGSRDSRDSGRSLQPSLGSGYDQLGANSEAYAAALEQQRAYHAAIIQHSIASAYGGHAAIGQPGMPQVQQGFSSHPPHGHPGSSGFGFGYSV